MKPSRTEYTNEAVRLADLTVNTDLLEDLQFENCQILGPAVLAPLGRTALQYCTFDGDFDDFIWVVPKKRWRVIGAIGARDCTFFRCRFVMVGVAVPEDTLDAVRKGFNL